jgi:hypothetical protein
VNPATSSRPRPPPPPLPLLTPPARAWWNVALRRYCSYCLAAGICLIFTMFLSYLALSGGCSDDSCASIDVCGDGGRCMSKGETDEGCSAYECECDPGWSKAGEEQYWQDTFKCSVNINPCMSDGGLCRANAGEGNT